LRYPGRGQSRAIRIGMQLVGKDFEVFIGIKPKLYPFTVNGLAALTRLPPQENRKLHDQYMIRRTALGRDLDLNAAIGTLALAECRKAGVAPELVVCHLTPVVNEVLTELAPEPARWRIPGGADESARFRDWMNEVEGPRLRRRVQELLGIQERPAHRFLVLQNGKPPFAADDIIEVFDRADAPVMFVVSAASLANQIRAHIPDPLFIFEH
jgi:hypothetical protein